MRVVTNGVGINYGSAVEAAGGFTSALLALLQTGRTAAATA